MHDQRLADHVGGRGIAQGDAGNDHVQMRDTFGIGTQVVHVAGVVGSTAGTSVRRTGGIEVRAGAAGVGGAAIAAFVHVETGHAAGAQATDRAGDADALQRRHQHHPTADQTARRRCQRRFGLLDRTDRHHARRRGGGGGGGGGGGVLLQAVSASAVRATIVGDR